MTTTDSHAATSATGKSASADTASSQSQPGHAIVSATSMRVWIDWYLEFAVSGIRSKEVSKKITAHLDRFRDWFVAGFGHDRITAVTPREVLGWRDHLADTVTRTRTDGPDQTMAPATVNNHLAHLSGFFTWVTARKDTPLADDPTKAKTVKELPVPAPTPRSLTDAQVRTVKNVTDRLDTFHRLKGRRHQGKDTRPAIHQHSRPARDAAIVQTLLSTGLRRTELTRLDLRQLVPSSPESLRNAKKAKLVDVRGKGRTTRTVFVGRDARHALADYLEDERPGDAETDSLALFLSAASINRRGPGGRLSPRSINNILAAIGRIHDMEITDPERQLGKLRPHDGRHTYGYKLYEESGHNQAELERRLGHANGRYIKLYTNPPEDVAAQWVEDL